MRVAALCDIHGNLPALNAVLAEVDRSDVDLIVVGGDVVSGPLPDLTLARLAELSTPVRWVRGNADREVVDAFDDPAGTSEVDPAAAFAARRLNRAGRDWLAAFEEAVVVEVDGLGPVRFCHGSPRSDTEMITTATPPPRLAEMLGAVEEATVVCGHTHRQFDRRVQRWRVINAGAIGMPYEGRRGAFWALFGPGVELRCTDYDVPAALEQMRAGGFAGTDDMLLESLIEPADPDWVAEYFERLTG